jgi:hypothetical protein
MITRWRLWRAAWWGLVFGVLNILLTHGWQALRPLALLDLRDPGFMWDLGSLIGGGPFPSSSSR